MTDARLRALERAALHGDPWARARFLHERRRTGRAGLGTEPLRLAAYLGDEDARTVMGEAAPFVTDDLNDWLGGLNWWGREIQARVPSSARLTSMTPGFSV